MNEQRRGTVGFSLLELLVALLVLLGTLAGVLGVFSTARRLTLAQAGTADLQQSLRLAQRDVLRRIRMAGRGGLPLASLPRGVAIAVRNDLPAEAPEGTIAPSRADAPRAVAGSDVLILRGVFSTPLYQIAPGAAALSILGEPPSHGWVRVADPSPSGLSQPLGPLRQAVDRGRREALLLVSARGSRRYGVAELAPDLSATDTAAGSSLTLGFRIRNGTYTAAYRSLCPDGDFPTRLGAVWQVGLLEEHRYYVRRPAEDAGVGGTLARARVYPATDVPHGGAGSNLSVPLADRVQDLQVALGLDIDSDGIVAVRATAEADAEWLFNSPEDSEGSAGGWGLPTQPPRLFYVRFTLVAHSSFREVSFVAPALPAIEDRPAEPTHPRDEVERLARSYRRWQLTSLAEPRNLW